MWQTNRKEFFPNGNMKDCAVWISLGFTTKRWWRGKDDSTLCVSPFGSLPVATLSRFARIKPWSKLLILPQREYERLCGLDKFGDASEDGGGGRIRTFEVDDGRFTVCSLWPLGNPARGISCIGFLARVLCQEAGRIISNEAPL